MAFELPDEIKFIQNNKLAQKHTNTRLDGKVCVISGATSGVGYESALALARAGAEIIILARNPEKAQKVCKDIKAINGKESRYYIADFGKLEEVRNAVKQLLIDTPKINLLINSVGVFNTRRKLTEDGHEMNFYVSHLSTHLLTRMLLPKLQESAPSRVIQVNSEGHRFGGLRLKDLNWNKRPYIGLRAYGAAKSAQLMCMNEFNKELKDTHVTINCMHPGAVKTNIGNNNGPLYRFWLHKILWHTMKDPEIAGDAVYYLAADPALEDIRGKFFNLTIEEKPATHILNAKVSEEIFKISEDLTSQ